MWACFPAAVALPDLLHPVCVSACVTMGKIIYSLSFYKKDNFLFGIQTQNAPSIGSNLIVITCPVWPSKHLFRQNSAVSPVRSQHKPCCLGSNGRRTQNRFHADRFRISQLTFPFLFEFLVPLSVYFTLLSQITVYFILMSQITSFLHSIYRNALGNSFQNWRIIGQEGICFPLFQNHTILAPV